MSIPSQETISIPQILEKTEIYYDKQTKTYFFLRISGYETRYRNLSYDFSAIVMSYGEKPSKFLEERKTLALMYEGEPHKGKWPFYFKHKEDVLLFIQACIEMGYVG